MRPPAGPGMDDSGPRALQSTSGIARRCPTEGPKRGQIWQAYASSTLRVLEIALPLVGGATFRAMQHDIAYIRERDRAHELQKRPCVILGSDLAGGTVDVVAFTTLNGTVNLHEINAHLAHFIVSVGTTRPWPIPESFTLETEPAWTTSPQYAVACIVRLPRRQLAERWILGGTFGSCSEPMLQKLENVSRYRKHIYEEGTTLEQRATWDLSYLVERERRLPGAPVVSSLVANAHRAALARLALSAGPGPAPRSTSFVPTHGRSYSEPAASHSQAWSGLPLDVQQTGWAAWSGPMMPILPPMSPPAPPIYGPWDERATVLLQAAASAVFAPQHGRSHSAPAASAFHFAPPPTPMALQSAILGGGMPGVARPIPTDDALRAQLAAAMGIPTPLHAHRF